MDDKADQFRAIYATLRGLMLDRAGSLDAALHVTKDEAGSLQIYTRHIMKNKQPLYFGGVEIKKNYVSYHLMPVYVAPDLLQGMSPALARRMQGKSCFNFARVDERLFAELGRLTDTGLATYRELGYL